MTIVSFINTLGAYSTKARMLSDYWQMPLFTVATKMALSRAVFGRGPYEFDRFGFAAKPLSDWRTYIIDEDRYRMQEESAPAAFRSLDEDKLQFWHRCKSRGLPTAPITAFVTSVARPEVPEGISMATNAAELADVLRPLGDFAGFAKPVGAGQGYGAFAFDVCREVVSAPAWVGNFQALFERCTNPKFGRAGYVLQPRFRPHPEFKGIMPGPGLGSIRINTFLRRDATLEMPWAHCNIPGLGAHVSNTRLGALIAPVDMETGRLGPAVGPTPDIPVHRRHEVHPETGARFADVVIPEWSRIKNMVADAAVAFSELPCLGWDVILTDSGPLLLETNWAFGVQSQEVAMDRGLRLELRQYIDRCRRRDR